MKTSKISALLFVAIMASACSTNGNNTAKVATKKTMAAAIATNATNVDVNTIDQGSITQKGAAIADWAYDMSNPLVLKEHVSNIFIGTVSSIDSATCNLPGNGYSSIPYTLGKINVEENFLGDVSGTVDFSRWGGTVTEEEYNRNAPKEALAKRNYLHRKSNAEVAKYETGYFMNDIRLQAGKTYLFYATYNRTYNRYEIQGFQYGTRQVLNFHPSNIPTSNANATIRNNATGKQESLAKYIRAYLP